jgi:DNA-binding YbaB/EbfC family protein
LNINPFDILKNAQKLQEQMGSFQEKLGSLTETGSAGGGMVEIEINGKMEVLSVRISPEAADPLDIEMLQDLIAAALNAAMEEIKASIQREAGSLAGLVNFPGSGFGE